MTLESLNEVRLLVIAVAFIIPMQLSAQEPADHGVEGSSLVTIEHAEIVLSPSPAGIAAGYLAVFNGTKEEIGLSAVTTADFDSVSLHKTEMDDGFVRMRPVEGPLRIPQGTELVMRPGGLHLMLMEPTDEVTVGGNVTLAVEFADGSTQKVAATVLEPGQKPTYHHHGEDDESGQ